MADCFVALDLTAEQMVLGLNRGLGLLNRLSNSNVA